MKLIAPLLGTKLKALCHNYSSKPLLSEVEMYFFNALISLAGGRCHIMCKPRLADFVNHHKSRSGFNKISQKHVDFLICRLDDLTPMLAIELDDSTHNKVEVRKRDEFVNNLYAHVGIPLVRINVMEIEHTEKLLSQLDAGWMARCLRLASSSQ